MAVLGYNVSVGLLDILAEEDDDGGNALRNQQLRCPMSRQPSYAQNRDVLGSLGTALFVLGAVVVLFIFLCYADIVRHILTRVPSQFKTHSVMAVGIYPLMALVTYVAMVVPKFQLLCEATVMFAWMVGLYQLFCLFVAYSGGETEITRQVESGVMSMQVTPCCCWPCCCFPKLKLTKKCLRIPRLLILQLSLVQSLVYLCLLVMWCEDEDLYQENYLYFMCIAIPSIFTSIWGMTMVLRMLAPTLQLHHMYGKYIVLQMALLFTKVQGTVARIVIMAMAQPCTANLAPSVLSYLICNGIFLLELVLLVVLARMFYLRPLPNNAVSTVELPQHLNGIPDNNNVKKGGIDNVIYT